MPNLRGRFDALGVYLLPGQVSTFFRLLRQQGVGTRAFGTDFFESKSEILQAAGSMEGAVFANNAVSEPFRARYVRRHGNDSQITFAGYGYDFAVLVGRVLASQTRRLTPEETVQALRSAPPHDGVLGRSRFISTPDGDAYFQFPVVLKQVRSGEIVQVE